MQVSFFQNVINASQLMEYTQVDDSGHRIRTDPAGNGKIRQVPFTGFYPEVRGIRAGNQQEINVSLQNLAGKVRIAAGCQLKNTGF